MLTVRPGTLEELLAIESRFPSKLGDNRQAFAQQPELAAQALAVGSRFLYEDGVPIAALGINPKWEAVGYGWGVISQRAADQPLALTRMAKAALQDAEAVGYRRIEAAVLLSFRPGLHWIRVLGFEREGKAHHYGPGALGTVVLFAKVF
ncbi:MAG: hypothetical protein L0170_04420 [Acidobacteria bacterium]|nr:hypothetical protein [Acidobacteriota bacterium]